MFSSPSRTNNSITGGVGRASRSGTPVQHSNSPRPSTSAIPAESSFSRSAVTPNPAPPPSTSTPKTRRRTQQPRSSIAIAPKSFQEPPSGQQSIDASAVYYPDSIMGSVTGQMSALQTGATDLQLVEGTLLSKDDVLSVSAFSRLSNEVALALSKVDLYTDPTFGELDLQTGFAYLCTRSACYVWSFISRGISSPTCYTFPLPTSSSSFDAGLLSSRPARNSLTLSLCSLVPREGKEPGLLVVLPEGEIRLWESLASSIGMSSSNDETSSYQRLALPLGVGEGIAALTRCEPKCYALSTTHSRLFRLSIHSSGGRLQVTSSIFSQPRGLISRFFGSASVQSLPSLSSSSTREGLFSLSIGASDSNTGLRELVAISQSSIQLWRLKENSSEGEKLVCEMDVRKTIENFGFEEGHHDNNEDEVNGGFVSGILGNRISIEDSQLFRDGEIALLFSFDDKNRRDHRGFGIATLELTENSASFVVRSVKALRYSTPRDPRPYSSPRLCLPHGGPAAFVVFPDTIISLVLEDDNDFEDLLSLKSSSLNRFLGLGFEPTDAVASGAISNLSVLTVRSGSLLLDFNWEEALKASSPDLTVAEKRIMQNERLRNKLDQAISFGRNAWNPIAFELETNFQGELQIAAEQLSHQLVTSTSEGLIDQADLRTQIPERLERLKGLMVYLNENGVRGKLSQSSRRQLRSDAELVAAANELWHYQNEYINTHSKNSMSPLSNSIEQVMSELGEGFGSDVVRSFFKSQLPRLSSVLEHLLKIVRSCSGEPLDFKSVLVHDITEVTLTLYQAAVKFRREHGSIYAIDDVPVSFEAWTAGPVGLDLLETLFHTAQSLVQDRSREFGSAVDQVRNDYADDLQEEDLQTRRQRLQQVLKAQLCGLAEMSLEIYVERKSYLQAASAENSALSNELAVLDSRYSRARAAMIHPLLSVGRQDKAFELAERHGDFRTLVELCNERTGADQSSANHRIDHYLQRYGKSFAFELYRWYVEKGQLRRLLEQDQHYGILLLDFLQVTQNQRISWIHLLNLGKFDEASHVLESISKEEKNLESQKLIISLGKLSYVAKLSEAEIFDPNVQMNLEKRFDDDLDLVQVHEGIKKEMLEIVEQLKVGGSEDAVSKEVTSEIASGLDDYLEFESLFATLTKRLLRGEVLSTEDLIDLLTLKSVSPEGPSNFSTAFQVFERAKDIPALRFADALRTFWRRVLLSSDWRELASTSSLSDQEISERLRSTALYLVLSNDASQEQDDGTMGFKTELIVDAETCLQVPSEEGLRGRMRGMPEHKLSLLRQDYERESAIIQELLDQDQGVDLAKWWNEVARLVRSDLESMIRDEAIEEEAVMVEQEQEEDSMIE